MNKDDLKNLAKVMQDSVVREFRFTQEVIDFINTNIAVVPASFSTVPVYLVSNPEILPTNDDGNKSCGFALFVSGKMKFFYEGKPSALEMIKQRGDNASDAVDLNGSGTFT